MRLLLVFLTVLLHPIHLTVTNVEYLPQDKEFKVSVRFFKDDFAKAVKLSYGVMPDLDKSSSSDNALLKRYVFDNLNIVVDGKTIKPDEVRLDGKRVDGMAIWFDFSFKYRKNPKKIVLTNKLMTNLYRDQRNLLIFTCNKTQKAFEFNTKHTKETINL